MKNKKTLGSLLLLFTAMIWGTAFAFQRAGRGAIEPFSFVAARMALSAAAVGIPAFFLKRRRAGRDASDPEQEREKRRETLLGGLCCGLFLGAASLFQQTGVFHTTAGKAGFITAMYILLVPILELLLFRKRQGALGFASPRASPLRAATRWYASARCSSPDISSAAAVSRRMPIRWRSRRSSSLRRRCSPRLRRLSSSSPHGRSSSRRSGPSCTAASYPAASAIRCR